MEEDFVNRLLSVFRTKDGLLSDLTDRSSNTEDAKKYQK